MAAWPTPPSSNASAESVRRPRAAGAQPRELDALWRGDEFAGTGAYLIEVSSDGRLVASLHALVHRTSRWHLGEVAWPQDWCAAH